MFRERREERVDEIKSFIFLGFASCAHLQPPQMHLKVHADASQNENLNPNSPRRDRHEDSTHDTERYSSRGISLHILKSLTRCQRKSELCLAAFVMVVYIERKISSERAYVPMNGAHEVCITVVIAQTKLLDDFASHFNAETVFPLCGHRHRGVGFR
jgi:hypothetical protein